MHQVNRPSMPRILQLNSKTWTDELMEQIGICGDYSKVPQVYKDKYKHPDIKSALCEMYSGCCCYCEGDVSSVAYGDIEHFKPKSIFPELSFKWDNLHYSCEICNRTYKKTNWNDKILDPSKDCIEEYISLNLATGEYYAINNNSRGIETIALTGINRKKLVSRRLQIICHFLCIEKRYGARSVIGFIKLDQSLNSTYSTVYRSLLEYFEQICNT